MLVDAPANRRDKFGSGAFGAPRGDRTHKGEDIPCYPGTGVLSVSVGRVTKIWYPYSQGGLGPGATSQERRKHALKKGLRYVQVTNGSNDFRYFYINPAVKVDDVVLKGDILGHTVSLQDIYPGITEHFHFEVKEHGQIINPGAYI